MAALGCPTLRGRKDFLQPFDASLKPLAHGLTAAEFQQLLSSVDRLPGKFAVSHRRLFAGTAKGRACIPAGASIDDAFSQ